MKSSNKIYFFKFPYVFRILLIFLLLLGVYLFVSKQNISFLFIVFLFGLIVFSFYKKIKIKDGLIVSCNIAFYYYRYGTSKQVVLNNQTKILVLSEFFKQTYNDNNTKASGVEIIERAGYKLIIINEKEEVFLSTEREGKIDRVIELISSNTTVSIKRKKKHFDLGKKGFFKGFNS